MIELLAYWVRLGGGLLLIPFFANFSEALVQEYTLPNILVSETPSVMEWESERKEVILKLFEEHVYGVFPKNAPTLSSVEVLETGEAFGGLATRTQVQVVYEKGGKELPLQLLIYTPVTEGPHKTIVSYNYEGNHTAVSDPDVLPSTVYAKRLPNAVRPFNEKERGKNSERFPVEDLLKTGFATVSVYYGDVDPDFNDNFQNGAHALYPELDSGSWGSLSAWAWGFSRVMDYIETNPLLDDTHTSLFGFSRHGKAALWTMANDDRFHSAVIDSSGDGGATLARRNFGETTWLMTFRFPHWFVDTYHTYSGKEDELPVDQHMLLALAAPRPLLISSADKDLWLDPKGEILAVEAAQEVYVLYDSQNLQHVLHEGGHEVTQREWDDYVKFFKRSLE